VEAFMTTNMQCPVCQETLTPTDRQGIEIDVCPRCRGVWLDRGELDKMLQREAAPPREAVPQRDRGERRYRDDDDDDYPRRRRSMWTELFD
jgi:Zn-finger nucleic acid-binding protein